MEDDLFGAPEAAPAEQPAAPAEEPAPMPAANGADDLFGAPEAEPAAPAAADDLFGAPEAAPAPAVEPAAPAAADDLFGEPMEEAAPAAEPAADAAAPAADAPAAEPAPADDLFGPPPTSQRNLQLLLRNQRPILTTCLAKTAHRGLGRQQWHLQTEGRLIEIGDDFVRLLKTNGRTCTVPMNRLSVEDADFVASVIQQQTEVKLAMNSTL